MTHTHYAVDDHSYATYMGRPGWGVSVYTFNDCSMKASVLGYFMSRDEALRYVEWRRCEDRG